METRVLQYFLKIAELGNITKAAAELHITQPTLSRQLQNLEEAVGTPLFKREKRQMILTSAGVLYQQRVQQILADIDKLNRDMQQCIALTRSVSAVLSRLVLNF
ncbi:LysR family transcriptional regulator [Ligilactobacillus apodemi]|uniref:LysR family transcriptional regulator n=1 Tax=Ligilactobacillus apodemi TaxID=307126 RepID=UPI00214C3894|nr:LysR family transcriptional regulator [Ligilactobacillus apodemi]MCR1902046.1 LysR family transcriptional regulator [Ligilactobacillus apodemi]